MPSQEGLKTHLMLHSFFSFPLPCAYTLNAWSKEKIPNAQHLMLLLLGGQSSLGGGVEREDVVVPYTDSCPLPFEQKLIGCS